MEDVVINSGMTLYDVNKSVIKQMPSKLTLAELEPSKKLLRSFKHLGYFMLMCKERNYYTVVRVRKAKNPDKFEDLIIELLQQQGEIKGLNFSEDKKNIECWVYNKEEDDAFMYLLFPYSWGVIECQ